MKKIFYLLPILFILSIINIYAYEAIGGNITFDGLYVIHTFYNNNSFIVNGSLINAEVLIVAGGGGGGSVGTTASSNSGGGGGAGGLIYTTMNISTGNYSIIIGNGGLGGPVGVNDGIQGGNSSFNSQTAVGGGYGGGHDRVGGNGGSGGGGGQNNRAGGTGVVGQGFNGTVGGANSGYYVSGAGGGSKSKGVNPTSTYPGIGGNGTYINISGSNLCYAGGGGGSGLGDGSGYSQLNNSYCGGGSGVWAGDGRNATFYGGGGGGAGATTVIGRRGGNGYQGIVIIKYMSEQLPSFNVTLTENHDINSSVLNVTFNTSVVVYNGNFSNDNYMTLYFSSITSLNNNCSIFYQNNCIKKSFIYTSVNMTKINNSNFGLTLYDNDIFPSYYPFNYTLMETSINYNDTIYKSNNIIFNITNMSIQTSQYNILFEMSASNNTYPSTLNIYYCNSSYAFIEPSLSTNCVLVDVFNPATSKKHIQQNGRIDNVIPIVITGVTKTQQSYIVIRSNAVNVAKGFTFPYILNESYNNASFKNCNDAFTCLPTNKIYQIHIHSYNSIDYLSSYSILYDGVYSAQSNSIIDYYNIEPFPPQAVNILTPNCSSDYTLSEYQNTTIYFKWLNSTSINNLSFTFNISLLNVIEKQLVGNLPSNNLSYKYSTNSNEFSNGEYYTLITTCDILGECDTSIQDCSFRLCVNDWQRTLQPCVDSYTLVKFSDVNNCLESFDVPITNGTYEICEVPATVGETKIANSIYTIAIILLILIVLIIFKVGEQK